jgi:hypothetical protein
MEDVCLLVRRGSLGGIWTSGNETELEVEVPASDPLLSRLQHSTRPIRRNTPVLKSPQSSKRLIPLLVILAGVMLACGGAPAAEAKADAAPIAPQESADVNCAMTFNMKGWSAIVSKSEGEGVITCDNGQTANVKLTVIGGGFTFGKTEIEDGKGTFSRVNDISEVLGSYAQAEASAGTASETRSAQALTKDNVSLGITAEGRGWSLGVSGAKFTIERVTG